MSTPALLILLASLILLALFLYWLIFLTEGAYLGREVVVWLYDLYAGRYDRIKGWVIEDEIDYLARPFANEVGRLRRPPLILDVAAGTGRLPLAVEAAGLLPDAHWVLLDASARMLAQARDRLDLGSRAHYLHHPAVPLPFADGSFDVVTCLEALEFMPDPEAALAELARVLRPGGLLVITNRKGWIARLMPGRTWSHHHLYDLHKRLNLRHVSIRTFLVDYEWVSSTKAGALRPPGLAGDAARLSDLDALADLQ